MQALDESCWSGSTDQVGAALDIVELEEHLWRSTAVWPTMKVSRATRFPVWLVWMWRSRNSGEAFQQPDLLGVELDLTLTGGLLKT